MFALKKILTAFLLPPGIFIVLLLFSGLWFLFKKNWKAGIINCFLGISMWAFSISPVEDAMLRGLESDFRIPENPHGDVIILLGGGVYDNAPDLSGIGAPLEDMLGRIITAVRLQKRLNVPVIVSGGAVFKGRKAEAPIVRRFLIDLGVPDKKVIIEDKSRDTIENAKYTAAICRKLGYNKPILVTSASHMRRSVMSFEKVGMKIMPFPANFKTWKNKKYGWEDCLPGSGKTRGAMKEYIGLLFYKFAY
ncbi:YdcF family protein [Dissulfurispira sp.]|uniref:YdcF family protein n=1 Tax=Dissulfurispira sp. TaxID=2817609 RepID=UPI002FD95FE8